MQRYFRTIFRRSLCSRHTSLLSARFDLFSWLYCFPSSFNSPLKKGIATAKPCISYPSNDFSIFFPALSSHSASHIDYYSSFMRPAFSSGHSSSFLLGQIADCIIIFLYLFRDRKVKPPLERNIIKEGQSIQKKQGILLTFLNWTIKLLFLEAVKI